MNRTVTITVVGLCAAAIEKACQESFYGADKLFQPGQWSIAGRRAASAAVQEYLRSAGIPWNSFDILSAKPTDTDGIRTPYKAEITFRFD